MSPDIDPEKALPEGKEWFSVRWIARHLSVSVNHVNNLLDSGAIKRSVDVRNAGTTKAMRRVHRSDLLAFLTGRTNQ